MKRTILGVIIPSFALGVFLFQNCAGEFQVKDSEEFISLEEAMEVPKGYEVHGDMIVRKGSGDPDQTISQGVKSYNYSKWPKGELFYIFDSSVTSSQRDRFRNQCRLMGKWANVKCTHGKGNGYYVRVITKTNISYCGSSYLGMAFAGQNLIMNKRCWFIPHVVQHELMHAFGISHEHTRPDRDKYLVVDNDAIKRTNYSPSNWEKISNIHKKTEVYDFDSIMHYTSKLDGQIVLWKRGLDKTLRRAQIHWPNRMSLYDHRILQKIYGGTWPSRADYHSVYDNKLSRFHIRCNSGTNYRRLCYESSHRIVRVRYVSGTSQCGEPKPCRVGTWGDNSLPVCKRYNWGLDNNSTRIWLQKGCNATLDIRVSGHMTYIFDSHHYLPGRNLINFSDWDRGP